MKIIDNRLYIEFCECIDAGCSDNTIRNAKLRGSNQWDIINDPDDKRKILVGYEKLKKEYKDKIAARYGDPYEYMAKMPIRNLVKYDLKAEKYFLSYRYTSDEGDKPLPTEHVKKYTTAASWLNMLRDFNQDKKALKRLLNLSIDQFYANVMEIFKTENIDLPTTYKRLMEKRKQYESEGYECLIDWRFGKRLAAKVKDEVASSMLLEMIAHPNQYDDTMIALQYNKWAINNGYKHIDPATVGVWRRKNAHLITMSREGNSAAKAKYIPVVKGIRPSHPLALVESDDNALDLLYIEIDRKAGDKHSARYVAIVVTDSYNDYLLGYAYAQQLSIDLVRLAYINAMHHVRSLTGNWYLPHEIKTDNWAIESLKPFYQKMGHFFQTPVGSKNRGYIENFFGSAHWKNAMKWGANNYTGNNMTAKYRGVNMEMLAVNKKDRPMIGSEADQQIESFFHRLRLMPDSKGTSKQAQWLEAWSKLDDNKKRIITEEQYLLKLGYEHRTKNGELPSITNRGLELQVAGAKYSYDIEGGLPIEHIGKKVHVYFDPIDMSRVLLTDHDKVRLMGVAATYHTKAVVDHTEGSRVALNRILSDKKEAVNKMANEAERRKRILDSAAFDAETALIEGIMTKEIKQHAEQVLISHMADESSTINPYDKF